MDGLHQRARRHGPLDVQGGTNYQDESGDVAIVISKADATVSVTGYTGVYDAAAHGASGDDHGRWRSGPSAPASTWARRSPTSRRDSHWTFTGGTNYNDQSGTAAIVIGKADATVTVSGYTGVYDAGPTGPAARASAALVILRLLAAGWTLGQLHRRSGRHGPLDVQGGTNYLDESRRRGHRDQQGRREGHGHGYTGVYDARPQGERRTITGVGARAPHSAPASTWAWSLPTSPAGRPLGRSLAARTTTTRAVTGDRDRQGRRQYQGQRLHGRLRCGGARGQPRPATGVNGVDLCGWLDLA